MAELPAHPTLADLQDYHAQISKERNFQNTVQDDALYLGEEVGELYKAIRKLRGGKLDPNSKVGTPPEEAVDVLMYLLAICNQLDINLEAAFREKEEVNKLRVWQ